MKNLNLYILAIVSVGMLAYSCEDIVQADKGDGNKTDGPSTEEVEPEKSEALKLGDIKNAKIRIVDLRVYANDKNKVSGEIIFEEKAGQVVMNAKLKGLKPGTHAIHLHEKDDCSSADGKSAGGHWNPTNAKHGKWGDAEGFHKGDIGNFEADANGNATVHFETNEWCIACDDKNKNIIGRSLVIHKGGDDFISQPSGDSGDRIVCAEITYFQDE